MIFTSIGTFYSVAGTNGIEFNDIGGTLYQQDILREPAMPVNYAVLSIAFSVVDGLAVILTLFRLCFRLKIQRFWWEDAWAAIAALCVVVSISTLPTLLESGGTEVVIGKVRMYMCTSIVWSVRMSLVFSIIRVTSSTLLRRILFATAACFILFWAATLGLQSWMCLQKMNVRVGRPGPTCVLPPLIPIFAVMTNLVADVMTVLFSMRILWRAKFPPRQHRMILFLFTGSIYLCLVSLTNAVVCLVGPKGAREILAYLQVTVFMLVCNLVVVVAFIYRVFWISRDDSSPSELESSSYDDDFTKPLPTTQNLTIVDLEAGPSGFTSELGSSCFHPTTPTVSENSSGLPNEP